MTNFGIISFGMALLGGSISVGGGDGQWVDQPRGAATARAPLIKGGCGDASETGERRKPTMPDLATATDENGERGRAAIAEARPLLKSAVLK